MTTLALVVIARNEARCITRCLRSLADHVDRMIVLDTGSEDDTAALARTAGAEVQTFVWRDDFAAARNAALDAAGADWHLVVDADEWLDTGAESLAAWRQTTAPQVGMVQLRNTFTAQGGACVVAASLPRLLPGSVRYRGRIHEQPDTLLPRVTLPLTLLHDGYADAQQQRKAGRNERLLRASLSDAPEDPYLLYQLGCELAARKRPAEAATAYAAALPRTPIGAYFRGDLVRRLLAAMQTQRQWQAAVELLAVEMPRYAGSAHLLLTVGNLFWNWAQAEPDGAASLWPLAEDAWLQALHLAGTAEPGQDLRFEQAGEHAALSLEALNRRLGRADRAAGFASTARALAALPSTRRVPAACATAA